MPVIKVKHIKDKASREKTQSTHVAVQVLGTTHKITAPKHRFNLLQMEPVAERAKAVTLKIAVYEGDEPVTSIEAVTFDSPSSNLDERQKSVILTLQDRPYDKRTPYRLVLRDAATGIEQASLAVIIDRAILMTSETTATDSSLDDLLNAHFAGRVVRKDLTKLVKEGANVPVYVLEYLLGNYCASNDPAVIEDGLATVKRILAENYRAAGWAEKVKSTIRERGSLKVIDKATVKLNEKRDVYEALLSNLGTKGFEISAGTVKKYDKLLAGGIWSIITMHYFYEEGQRDRPSSSIRSPQSRCRTWIWTRCWPGGDSSPRHNGLTYCYAPADTSRRISTSGPNGTCCAVTCRWSRTTTTFASWVRGEPAKSHIYKEISPNSILISGGQTLSQTCFTIWRVELLVLLGSGTWLPSTK